MTDSRGPYSELRTKDMTPRERAEWFYNQGQSDYWRAHGPVQTPEEVLRKNREYMRRHREKRRGAA